MSNEIAELNESLAYYSGVDTRIPKPTYEAYPNAWYESQRCEEERARKRREEAKQWERERKKYELDKTDRIEHEGRILYRILATRSVKGNELDKLRGGYVEGYHNLSPDGESWVGQNAKVYGNAIVKGNAAVDWCWIHDDAVVSGDAKIRGGHVCGSAIVRGNAESSYGKIEGGIVEGNAYIDSVTISEGAHIDGCCIKRDISEPLSNILGKSSHGVYTLSVPTKAPIRMSSGTFYDVFITSNSNKTFKHGEQDDTNRYFDHGNIRHKIDARMRLMLERQLGDGNVDAKVPQGNIRLEPDHISISRLEVIGNYVPHESENIIYS